MQFTDGTTTRLITQMESWHRNGILNGAFLDGHAQPITAAALGRIDRDGNGCYFHDAAADR